MPLQTAMRFGFDRRIAAFVLAGVLLTIVRATPVVAQCHTEQVAKLQADDGDEYDLFGVSVSVSGRIAVIGRGTDHDNGVWSGSAYIFRFDPDKSETWIQEAKLLADDGRSRDFFGRSVSISGDTVLVGAPGDDDNGASSGSAYILRYDPDGPGRWVQEAKLLPGDGARADLFGSSVAISGGIALIGTPFDDDNGSRSGSAYVFRFDGSSWTQEAKLRAEDGAADDDFGDAVSLSGDAALIGAVGNDDRGSASGSAYVFRRKGSAWVQEAKLLPGDGARSDYFGLSVAISGGIALVGAPGDDDQGSSSGSAYTFRFNGSHWVREAKLLPDDGQRGDSFGQGVALSGERAVIGAFCDDDNGNCSGSAYLFRFSPDGSGRWRQADKMLADDGKPRNQFGQSVSISGDTVIVGATGEDDFLILGSVYVYESSCSSGACCIEEIGDCTDDVPASKCSGSGFRFESGVLCDDLDPPCGIRLCMRDPGWICDGDVDGNGRVDVGDLYLVETAFGSTDEQDLCNYDADCDGQINPVDSGMVQSLFGTCEEPRESCP